VAGSPGWPWPLCVNCDIRISFAVTTRIVIEIEAMRKAVNHLKKRDPIMRAVI
jgi:hypothetical protein